MAIEMTGALSCEERLHCCFGHPIATPQYLRKSQRRENQAVDNRAWQEECRPQAQTKMRKVQAEQKGKLFPMRTVRLPRAVVQFPLLCFLFLAK